MPAILGTMPKLLSTTVCIVTACALALALLAVATPAAAVDLKKECVHLTEHLAIDHKLHNKLKLDQVRVRCGKRTMQGDHAIREVTLFRLPAHESSVRIDSFTGRLLTLSVDRLPIPELAKPRGGWPSLVDLTEIARAEAEVPADASLVKAHYVTGSDNGLMVGRHPFAEFVFEHTVEEADVIGDRIIARVDLRSKRLVWLDARRWTQVKSPDSRTTEGRALRTARKALRRLAPAMVPCCQPRRAGEAAETLIGAAMDKQTRRKRGAKSNKATKRGKRSKRGKRKRARKRRRKGKRPIITCVPRHRRRVYLHDRKGKLVEAYEVGCVPTCERQGVVRQCTKNQAVMSYVATKSGKLLGMKGDIAPERYKWQRPPAPNRSPLAAKQLDRRATTILERAIKRLEPLAETKNDRCPPTEDDATVVRRCRTLMLPAMQYRARQTHSRIVFEMPK
jgi:hypothetical protein